MTDAKISSLRAQVMAAAEEFDLAIMFHEAWKPAAYDTGLRDRMGVSYATNTFQIIRSALRREMLLALMRLWDKPASALRMEESIARPLRDSRVIDALATERAENIGLPEAEDCIRDELNKMAKGVLELVDKYGKSGTHSSVKDYLKRLRHERLAHRRVTATDAVATTANDQQIEEFYQDNAKLIKLLLSLVKATAYNPLEAGEVHANYARFFWEAAKGERTEGHPNYRPT